MMWNLEKRIFMYLRQIMFDQEQDLIKQFVLIRNEVMAIKSDNGKTNCWQVS